MLFPNAHIFCSFSLIWTPVLAKISKCYYSYEFHLNFFSNLKLYLNGPHKSTPLDFWNLRIYILTNRSPFFFVRWHPHGSKNCQRLLLQIAFEFLQPCPEFFLMGPLFGFLKFWACDFKAFSPQTSNSPLYHMKRNYSENEPPENEKEWNLELWDTADTSRRYIGCLWPCNAHVIMASFSNLSRNGMYISILTACREWNSSQPLGIILTHSGRYQFGVIRCLSLRIGIMEDVL